MDFTMISCFLLENLTVTQSTSDTSQIPANSEDEMWLDQPSG
jgi:hypothetical protein